MSHNFIIENGNRKLVVVILFVLNAAVASSQVEDKTANVTKSSVADISGSKGNVVTDVDGNTYSTVKIGSHEWIVENLKSTKYKDGTDILLVTDNTAWSNLTTPGYSWYKNNMENKDKYGALYNWYTVNTEKLCPCGWHVPTDAEWTTLENYLVANGYNFDDKTTGNKIAKSLASDSGWTSSSIPGTVGNSDYVAKRNATGFTGLPGGYRYVNGGSWYIGLAGHWWSATGVDASTAFYRVLFSGGTDVKRSSGSKAYGFSVRCIADR